MDFGSVYPVGNGGDGPPPCDPHDDGRAKVLGCALLEASLIRLDSHHAQSPMARQAARSTVGHVCGFVQYAIKNVARLEEPFPL